MADTFKVISIILFILAAIFFIASIIIFIYFRINKIIGDLSGHNEKKSIKRMQNQKANQISDSNINLINSDDKQNVELYNNLDSETARLQSNIYEKSNILHNDYGIETTILSPIQLIPVEKQFNVKKEIILIHTKRDSAKLLGSENTET